MTKSVIGVVGLGKIGMTFAVSIASRGFKVLGYDINPNLMRKQKWPWPEKGPDLKDDFQDYFDGADLAFLPLNEVVSQADIIFIAVQTPHGPELEGVTRLPQRREDFNYTWLKEACANVMGLRKPEQVIVVISTVLPGTMRREILPMIPDLVYNPVFPSLTTCCNDFLYPDFVLMGSDITARMVTLRDFYDELLGGHLCPIAELSIESAELAKVSLNTWVTAKVTLANQIMEVAHKIPNCNCDDVIDVLSLSHKKVLSSSFMRGGMGFSGPCFPRDCIAMSWLADKLNLSCNLFDSLSHSREWQTEWLAYLFMSHSKDLPKVILGKSYKPDAGLTPGSCAVLLANILKEKGVEFEHYDPYVDDDPSSPPFETRFTGPKAFFVATKHKKFAEYHYPEGSTIVDPFRYIQQRSGIVYVPVGVGK